MALLAAYAGSGSASAMENDSDALGASLARMIDLRLAASKLRIG
jgi:hypothetical protein